MTISIASSCPALSGNATVTITNTSNAAVSGTLQFIVKERGIKFTWGSNTFVDCAVRDMLPDEKGEAVSLAAGESTTKSRAFTLNSGWVKDSCKLVAFLQKSDKEIIEGCVSGLNQGTPITTNTTRTGNTIECRVTPESFLVYIPGTGSAIVTFIDVHGREIAHFTVNDQSQWHALPIKSATGITIVKVKKGENVYLKKVWALR